MGEYCIKIFIIWYNLHIMRILLVEDDKNIANSLKTALESECFVVDAAEDGEQGAYCAQLNDYDLMILDNMLPKKEGIEVCREVRRCGKTLPIIMLSVKSDASSKTELLNAGADDYMTKPFSFDELIARIRAIMRRPKQMENDIIQVDNLILDGNKHSVIRGDKEVYLTRKEFILLKHLMKNQGAVLSRAAIMERVWDMDADPFSNIIESHIMNLRKKIDFGKHKKLIATVPGRGYKIDMA